MSISNPETQQSTENPVSLIIEWSAKNGNWKVYDKIEKIKIELEENFKFAVLDQKNGVAGFIEGKGMLRSNEVSRIDKEELTVISWKDGESSVYKEGMYADMKDELKAKGIKVRKIVYAQIIETNSQEFIGCIAKIDLGGAAMSSWIDATIPTGAGVSLGDPVEKVTPMMKYYSPVFNKFELEDEQVEYAISADKLLQEFNGKPSTYKESTEEVPF